MYIRDILDTKAYHCITISSLGRDAIVAIAANTSAIGVYFPRLFTIMFANKLAIAKNLFAPCDFGGVNFVPALLANAAFVRRHVGARVRARCPRILIISTLFAIGVRSLVTFAN